YRADDGNVLVELQADFEVGPGPNFWLYLNSVGGIDDEGDFEADNGRRRIAKLKSFTGSQVYAVNAGDFKSARAVTVWCESFGQYIASADI
ncbi:MAG: DM13 domain-containing protein, partial [Gammaproteobacteria bacterium]|nr:DM13 domain-containing protein [Gammaproteobacteria bacterium]